MSNPWVALYEQDLAFRSEWDQEKKVIHFRNMAPAVGEQGVYASVEDTAFVAVALLKRPPGSREGNVLILQGTNMEATEAGWDFAADRDRQESVLRGLKGANLDGGYQLEVLLETTALAGSHRNSEVRAVRVRTLEPGRPASSR